MISKEFHRKGESGAALMTVILVSLLLGTACIALLSAVGASSQNNTDALSEAKAYWAAESGLQATINVLRNTAGMNYNTALTDPDLSTWLTYDANGKIVMNSEAAYTVQVSNPDASLPYTFYTTGSFNTTSSSGVTLDNAASPARICFPNCLATTTNRTEITFAGNGAGNPTSSNSLGTFTITKVGNGAPIPSSEVHSFRIEFQMTSPRTISRTIRGKIPASNANQPVNITFDSQVAELSGSEIELCSTQTPPATPPPAGQGLCPTVSFQLSSGAATFPLYAAISPIEPYRLLVTSTGFGPNSSQKKLEGIIIKDLLYGLPSTSALTMVGPGAELVFQPGPGTPTYCGVDPGIEPGEDITPGPGNSPPPCVPNPNSATAPAIGVTDQEALDEVNDSLGNTQVVPAPDILTDGPEWLESATALHNYVSQLRARSQTGADSSYFPDGAGVTTLQPSQIGNFTTGGGLTFCEGSCIVGPGEGGGILVVTGNFEYHGNYNHRGTILVIGDMHRNGGGTGVILGSVIIAKYDPNNLAAGFQSPRFTTSGGGTSDIIYNGAANAYDGTAAVTNLMIGVAEK